MSPALIALLPFLGALLPGLLVRAGRDVAAIACGTVTLVALIGLALHIPAILDGRFPEARITWLPQIGLAADFRIDGLALLFALLILGIGLLIIAYARYYLGRQDNAGTFLTYLMLFQGAMTGIVLTDNILMLLVFWELTSLSSFLLIGFWRHLPEGRQGARMALIVTGAGGLAMIAGMLILGQIAGTTTISGLLAQGPAIKASPLYLPALALILVGAFTKSAQVPFHFWLPHAMAAPTPVSAYLHSATMVKAGIFLMARLWPVLSGTPEWFALVSGAGLLTMLVGAWIALFRDDLKSLLAFSTVSHLGLVTMLLGFGTPAAAVAAMLHVLNHASFKAALFMIAGIVEHETGARAISRLGGLRRAMPLTFALAAVAALSMAGVPPLNGFLSKELMLEAAAGAAWAGNPWLIGALATLGAALSVAYALRFLAGTFLGAPRGPTPQAPHDPGPGLWLPPAILAAPVIAIGLMPNLTAGWLVAAAADAVTGAAQHPQFRLWHGLTPALGMSALALAAGALLAAGWAPLARLHAALPRPEAKAMFDAALAALRRGAAAVTDGVTNGSLGRALAVLTLWVLLAGALGWAGGGGVALDRPMLPVTAVDATGWVLAVVATGCMVAFHRDRILALVLIGIVGLIVSLTFARLSAPDLALTQISVEVVTVVLLLLALRFLPRRTRIDSPDVRRGFDAMVATLAGLGMGALAWVILRSQPGEVISGYMTANSYRLGGGNNVVNVILVDFRGYDTFGEITVLGIAALVIFALTEAMLAGRAGRRLRDWTPDPGRSGDRHPLVMVVATRVALPITLTVGLYVFLRGHNAPGGGFVAGLVVSVALVMQYMASGFAWASARQHVPYHALIAGGVLAAGITGMAAWFRGLPFLTSAYGYLRLPGLEPVELATAMGFDLGVFLCVVGATMLALASLSRLARAGGEGVNTRPMDDAPRPAAGNA